MENDRERISRYHEETSHQRGNLTGRALNWKNQPLPFKIYRHVPTFPLANNIVLPQIPIQSALDEHPLIQGGKLSSILSGICNLTAGITLVQESAGDTRFHFRAAPSAGALYPAELYVVLQNVNEMNDGLYHYCPLKHVLSQLRGGPVFKGLGNGTPAVRFYLTSIFHRSAWKYGARAYRYCLLDTGHMAENLLLASRIHGLPATLDYDFNDSVMTRILGIHPDFEGCLAQVHAMGCGPETLLVDTSPLTAEDIPAYSVSALKAQAPEELLLAHQATASFARCPERPMAAPVEKSTPLPDPALSASTAETIMQRRSRRNFVSRNVMPRDLVDIIGLLCRDVAPICTDAIQVGFLAGKSSGLKPGYHRLNRGDRSTTLVKPGDFMAQSAQVCLDQGWLENAALHFVFTADLARLREKCGPRSYRYAHLEAGRLGQSVYLAATAKNLGVCGIGAFFDDEGASLLSLPDGHKLLYLVAIGPTKK